LRGFKRVLQSLLIVVLALGPAASHAADPLMLILLRLLRDKVISTALENAYAHGQREARGALRVAPNPAPPWALDDQRLRQLIDEGFVHLTDAQRTEVFAGVKRILADPKNAAAIPVIIEELAIKASAVRQAHEAMSALSASDKRLLARDTREELLKMPSEERQQLLQILRSNAIPLPGDLRDLILADFARLPGSP